MNFMCELQTLRRHGIIKNCSKADQESLNNCTMEHSNFQCRFLSEKPTTSTTSEPTQQTTTTEGVTQEYAGIN